LKRLLVLSVLVLANLAAPLAAAPHWTPLGPYGGFVDTLTIDPVQPQVLYATSDDEGTFKSANGGATWSLIHTGIASGNVAVDPSRHTTIYQTLNFNQVLKSADGGATWTSSSRGLPNATLSVLAVDPAQRTRVYAASDGVWHSLDGGFTWKRSRRPLPEGVARHVVALAVARRPAGTVYAATGAGVFKSVDGGDSWKPASRGLPPGPVIALVMAPSNPQILWASAGNAGVFRSTNGGGSWSATAGQPEEADNLTALAVAPGNPSTAWVGTFEQGVYRTTDAGAHWTPAGPRATTRVEALAATSTTLYAGVAPDFRDPGGVLASGDGGGTWQPRNTGLFALETPQVAIDPHHPESLWAAAGASGLYRSDVGGRVWDLPTQPPAPAAPTSLPTVNGVAFSADGAVLYTAFNQALWASDDAGASWRLSLGPETTPSTSVVAFLPHPTDAATVYSWSEPSLYASHDSGVTWQTLSPGLLCLFDSLAVAPSAPATLYAGGANSTGGPFGCRQSMAHLVRSEDGGSTWVEADAGLGGRTVTSLAVDPLDSRTVYAQTPPAATIATGIWRSTDGGDTWLRGDFLTVDHLVFSADGGTLWGTQGAEVFASHNGGASWQSLGGPQVFNIDRLIPDPIDPDRLYAATWGGVWVFQ
jgi:photosystem II stability/assembly factor-like uncharacterized protein